MVKIYSGSHVYSTKWEDVTCAFWRKYSVSNPQTKHVTCSDVIERHVDPATHCLHTRRLLVKTNAKPKWGELISPAKWVYVVEDSVVDPLNKVMTTQTRNVMYTGILSVNEKCVYTVSEKSADMTDCKTTATIHAGVWGFRSRLENFAFERFKNNVGQARQALQHVIELMKTDHSKPDHRQ